MEVYDMSKASPVGSYEKRRKGPCSLRPSLAHVFAIVVALMYIAYTLSALRAQAGLVADLKADISVLKDHVDRLNTRLMNEDPSNGDRNQERYLKMLLAESWHSGQEQAPRKTMDYDENASDDFLERLLMDSNRIDLKTMDDRDGEYISQTSLERLLLNSRLEKSKVDEMDGPTTLKDTTHDTERNTVSSENFLEKLFGNIELQDTTFVPELMENNGDRDASSDEDSIFVSADSSNTPLHYHSDKLSTNQERAPDDVGPEYTNDKKGMALRPKRQAEGNRESRNRKRDQTASRAERRNRRNRDRGGGRREQGRGEIRLQNGGATSDRRLESEPDAYIHFFGNVSSRVNTRNLLRDWAYANWTRVRQKQKFELHNGIVTVKEHGVYFLYSQVQFFDDDRYMGAVITVNEKETFKCTVSPPDRPRNMNACYVGGLVYLHHDSRVAVRVAFPNRWVNMHHDCSYFGMYKVA